VGEIGLPINDYLYRLSYADLLLISRGYENRKRDLWSATRWQTYHLMLVSLADIQKAGINSPKDLMPLPWDETGEEEEQVKITKEEIERMREDMRRMNEKAGTK
jgi:hypothetical protein